MDNNKGGWIRKKTLTEKEQKQLEYLKLKEDLIYIDELWKSKTTIENTLNLYKTLGHEELEKEEEIKLIEIEKEIKRLTLLLK